ncbi:MAG: hypothetical protein JRJ80_17825 [Deltaproteobacteria bacterium]|jgi:hypothetical protein|nr:hypothetical protein [Deltaproteobacteria bacterium]
MGQRGTSLATYDSRRFPYQLVVGQRLHHEECEVDTSSHVALENGIAVGGGLWTPTSTMGYLLLTPLPTHAGLSFELA